MVFRWALLSLSCCCVAQRRHSFFFLSPSSCILLKQHSSTHNKTPQTHTHTGDTGAVEVWLANPLSVPLRLDRVTLHARLHPIRQDCGQSHQQDQSHKLQPRQQHQSQQPPSEAANATTTSNNDSNKEGDSSAFSNISFSTSHSLWQPHTLEGPVVLPQGGRPTKLQFRGRALAEGRLHLLGVHASAWGVTWLQV